MVSIEDEFNKLYPNQDIQIIVGIDIDPSSVDVASISVSDDFAASKPEFDSADLMRSVTVEDDFASDYPEFNNKPLVSNEEFRKNSLVIGILILATVFLIVSAFLMIFGMRLDVELMNNNLLSPEDSQLRLIPPTLVKWFLTSIYGSTVAVVATAVASILGLDAKKGFDSAIDGTKALYRSLIGMFPKRIFSVQYWMSDKKAYVATILVTAVVTASLVVFYHGKIARVFGW